jgi:hypothetical protein
MRFVGRSLRPAVSALVFAAALGSSAAMLPVVAGAQTPAPDPLVAPATTLSADGRTATDGRRSLTVSQAAGLPDAGGPITVTGTGYDDFKGIYVALCLVPPPNQPPTPCGGGPDTEGASGSSAWISSNPPSYGEGLATPYGPGGTFTVTVHVNPLLAEGFDCRAVRCAVVTRNDHTRSVDRSQDIFVPVTFAAPQVAPPTTPQPPTTLATTTTAAPTTTTTAAPSTTAAPTTTTTDAPADAGDATGDERAAAAGSDDGSDGSGSGGALAAVGLGALVVGGGSAVAWRTWWSPRRRASAVT